MDKEKLEQEYVIRCSPKVLYNRLSTASGLSEWFADNVTISGKIFSFVWDGAGQDAELAIKKENNLVRFEWVDDDTYFEFKISKDELTGDVSLIITDFAEEDEIEETRSLWDSQVSELKRVIGS